MGTLLAYVAESSRLVLKKLAARLPLYPFRFPHLPIQLLFNPQFEIPHLPSAPAVCRLILTHFAVAVILNSAAMSTNIKEEARRLIDRLPEDITWDDLMHEIYVRQSVEAGLDDSKAGKTVEVAEVRARFGLEK